MSDPLSIASAVVGLIAVGGATFKTFYQFFRSIHDAPAIVRDVAAALCMLNVSLGQVQEVLLNPSFVRDAEDSDSAALLEVVSRGTELYTSINSKVQASGLADERQNLLRKAWESVKHSFNEQDMAEFLVRIEREKSNLSLILESFTARMMAGLTGEVRKLQVLAKKQDRRLKDIHTFCEWVVDSVEPKSTLPSSSTRRPQIEYTGFAASQVYDANDLRNLLRTSGSVLSLQIGDVDDDTASAILTPDAGASVPARQIKTRFLRTRPTIDDMRRALVPEAQSLHSIGIVTTPLVGLAQALSLATMRKERTRRLTSMLIPLELCSLNPMTAPGPIALKHVLSTFIGQNDVLEADLKDIADLMEYLQMTTQHIESLPDLAKPSETLNKAILEFVKMVTDHFQMNKLKRISSVLSNENMMKRVQLKGDVDRAANSFKSRLNTLMMLQASASQSRIEQQQQEMLRLLRSSPRNLTKKMVLLEQPQDEEETQEELEGTEGSEAE